MLLSATDNIEWYDKKGVERPAEFPHLSQAEQDEVLHKIRSTRKCEWIQQGPEIICQNCVNTHGMSIGRDDLLAGTDSSGAPLFKKVTIL
jgi:hypothetical protein